LLTLRFIADKINPDQIPLADNTFPC
jgi:hypothetical protein